MTRYVIYGAGAIGGVFSAELLLRDREVVLIARGAQLDAIRAGGLEYITPERRERLTVPVVEHPRAVDFLPGDVVILAVKGQDTSVCLDELSRYAPPETPIVCAQNGVENERSALRRFGNVYAMSVLVPSLYLEPGIVAAHSAPVTGVLHLGRYPSGTDAVARELEFTFRETGMQAHEHADIRRWKYAKLLSNLGNAARAVLVEGGEGIDDVVSSARAEGEAALVAAGIDYVPEDELNATHAPVTPRRIEGVERGLGSTWQSLRRGAPSTETDYLNGEVVLLGRLYGVETPVNARLQELSRQLVTRGLPPCSVAVSDFYSGL